MRATCHIVSGGNAKGFRLTPAAADLVIAADSGYAACIKADVPVDVLVGDFDSLADGRPVNAGCEVVELPCAKDDTDTLAALRIGLARGYRYFQVHAALGGDVGHELANIHCLRFLLEHAAFGELIGCGQRVALVDAGHSPYPICAEPGTRLSVFAFGGIATGVFEHGTRWELEGAVLAPGDAIGCSNEVMREDAEIGVTSGCLLVVVG